MTKFGLEHDFASKLNALSFSDESASLRLDEPSTGVKFASAATPAAASTPAAVTPALPRNEFKLS